MIVSDPLTAHSGLAFVEAHFNGSGVLGLHDISSIAVSPDGNHVYTTGPGDSEDAVGIFSRNNATGELTYEGAKQNGVGDVPSGLDYVFGVAVSPDGKHVYTVSRTDGAIVVFSRNSSTGALAYVERHVDASRGGSIDELMGAYCVVVSPDGGHVYVGTDNDDSVVVFSRDSSTGALTYVETQLENDSSDGGNIPNLDRVYSLAVSPDGDHVYAGGYSDDAVIVFSRDSATGKLTFVETHTHDENGDGTPNLNGISSVAVSPDGKHVYTASRLYTPAVAVFSRDNSTGALTHVETIFDDGCGGSVDGLLSVKSVIVSPDGNYVYTAAEDDSAVVVFSRDGTTGKLTYIETHKDNEAGVDGLYNAWRLAASPYGNHVYVAGYDEDAIAVFKDTSGPQVTSTNPINEATDVLLHSLVSATFTKPMDASSITTTSFTVSDGIQNINGTISFSSSDTVATFTPTDVLSEATTYTASLSTDVTDVADNPLASVYSWSFTSGSGPQVTATIPANQAAGVSTTSLSATFSEAIDTSTVTAGSFTVSDGTQDVNGTISFSSSDTVATFTPTDILNYGERYTATLTTAIADLDGNAMSADYEWTFATEKMTIKINDDSCGCYITSLYAKDTLPELRITDHAQSHLRIRRPASGAQTPLRDQTGERLRFR
ncbi:MAG: Ig-like domain-containing protein [Desulfobacteraceae bacterium]